MRIFAFFLALLLPTLTFASTAPTEIKNDSDVKAQTLSATSTAVPDDYIKTTGVIKSIEIKWSRKVRKHLATVEYKIKDSKETLTSVVDLFAVPFIWTFDKEGDTIEIFYSKSNPALINTQMNIWWEKYGMIALYLLGIIFSVPVLISAIKKGRKEKWEK